jgi:hypothetical protein
MDRLFWKGITRPRPCGAMRDSGRRTGTKRRPACEPLDSRQLLSTVVALPMPQASVAANAAATLNADDPKTFAKFQSDLAQAESHSQLTQAQVDLLAQDETAIDQAIESAGYSSSAMTSALSEVRSVIDYAFQTVPSHVETERVFVVSMNGQPLRRKHDPSVGENVQTLLDPAVSQVPDGKQLVSDTIDQMRAVDQAVDLTPRLYNALKADGKTLSNNAGPGNFVIDFDSQVQNFVH